MREPMQTPDGSPPDRRRAIGDSRGPDTRESRPNSRFGRGIRQAFFPIVALMDSTEEHAHPKRDLNCRSSMYLWLLLQCMGPRHVFDRPVLEDWVGQHGTNPVPPRGATGRSAHGLRERCGRFAG